MIKSFYDRIPKIWISNFKYIIAKSQKPVVPNKKKAYLFLAADYGNLGDIALTFAQKQMLLKYFPDYAPIEVPSSISMGELKGYIHSVKKDDIVTIIAGGNMGDIWSWFEVRRQLIISKLKKHIIFQFPQTTTYTKARLGQNLLTSAKTIYKGKRIKMLAREKMSYSFIQDNFSCQSFLAPDIVMTLKYWHNPKRKGILLCLRNDREKMLSNNNHSEIMSIIDNTNIDVSFVDTKIDDTFIYNKRYYLLEQFLERVSKAEVIVTDRLHGMIFAYITGTPAVVLPNSNNKIKMCYEWIRNCGFIHFIPSYTTDDFKLALDSALTDKVDKSTLESNNVYFQSIFNNIFENEK